MIENPPPANILTFFYALGAALLMTGWMQAPTLVAILFAWLSLKQRMVSFYYIMVGSALITGVISDLHVCLYAFGKDKVSDRDPLAAGLLPFLISPIFFAAMFFAIIMLVVINRKDEKDRPKWGPYDDYLIIIPILLCVFHFGSILTVTMKGIFRFS